MNESYKYKKATLAELDARWNKNIADNIGDERWIAWKETSIENHKTNKAVTFVVLFDEEPVGEGTLIFSLQSVEINGLRIDKEHEGKGHVSRLVKVMEQYAKSEGYKLSTIGVEPKETRNLAIYLHWGYNTFDKLVITDPKEEEGLILYYSKQL